ncbi:pilus assembly protein TadG-related protein [Falsiroseomonas sp. HC035]|uniref:pilus assembly protein TadG-related protein n=1 Tax=Falsiroseomonas sp. HC035 TaxID=3390999 RepID=UPI003D31D7C5
MLQAAQIIAGRRGRRGSVAGMTAVSFTVLIGFLGLAAEGGTWYLAARNASTAVDLAALAGAMTWEAGGAVVAVATDTATRNGFVTDGRTTVAISHPPTTGTFAGNAAAVEVVITQRQEVRLVGMFVDAAPTIRRRAVAIANIDEQVCLLALGGGLELGGNSTTHATRCALAANTPAPGGIRIYGSASVRAAALVTTGTCSGCTSGDVWADAARTQRPVVTAGRVNPVTDPFAGLQGWTPSLPACRSGAVTFTSNKATLSPGAAICENLTIGTKDHLHLEPGIYYLRNADLTVQGKITGDGVTLVMTGDADRVGTLRINAQATGALRGPATSLIAGHPEAAGLVAYRDARATNNGSTKEVQLNGGATMQMFGGMYFPSSDVVVNGNSGIGYSSCLGVIGYRLSFSGSSDTDVDVSGCAGFTPFATLRTVRLVE